METFTNSKIAVSWTSIKIIDKSENRRYIALCNDSSDTIYIAIWWEAELNKWIRLNWWGWVFEINFQNPIRADIYAISTWTDSNLAYTLIS